MTLVYLLITQNPRHSLTRTPGKSLSKDIFLMHCKSDGFHYSLVTKQKKLHRITHVSVDSDTFIPASNASCVFPPLSRPENSR